LLKKYERLSLLRHPALQRVVGSVREEDAVYVVMAFRDGRDLKQHLAREGRFRDPVQAGRIILDLLDGLAYLHRYRFIHTDIKPANILLYEDRYGHLRGRLLDPGEALWLEQPLPERKPFSMIYSPPEQVLGRVELISPASDLYSLGVVMWEMLTGRKPFQAPHPAAIINLQLNAPLEKKRVIPREYFEIIGRATAKHPLAKPPRFYSREEIFLILRKGMDLRYSSARFLAADLFSVISV
jgi:serine/threonine-protein kinase